LTFALTGVALIIVTVACGAYFGIIKGKVRKITQYVDRVRVNFKKS